MMGALPQTLTAPLPSLLATLTPTQSGEAGDAGGFDQLVAQQARGAVPVAAPVATPVVPAATQPNAPAVALPIDTAIAAPATAISTPLQPAPAIAQQDAAPSQALPVRMPKVTAPSQDAAIIKEATAETPAPAKTAAASTDKAIVAANELLATLAQFPAPGIKPAPAKPAVAAPATESEEANDGEAPVRAENAPTLAWLAPTVAPAETRGSARPAAEAAPASRPRRDEAPALPAAAPKTRDAAPLPLPTLAALEPQAAKPAAEPSMTILFAQPATQAGAMTEAAKPVLVAERILDLTSDDAWIDQLASDIAATKSASNEVSFRLMPRHLGRLDVSMMMGDDGVSLKLDTQHEATATIVTAAQVRLVDDLRQQGVRVADTQVTHSPTDAGRQSQQGQGRSPAPDATHLIETATERDPRDTHDQERAGDRRGRFA